MTPVVFRRGGAANRSPSSLIPGQVYLDVKRRKLSCLNDRARQLRAGGVPFIPDDLARRPLHTLGGQPVTATDLPLVAAYQEGRNVEATFVARREGGAVEYVTWSATPLRDSRGEITAIVGSVVCAPPDPDWQALAGMAHDLRTPLQALKLLVTVLDQAPGLDDQQHEALDRIRSAAERALAIGRDLLNWCRSPVEAGRRRDEPAWFPLGPFLQNLAAEQSVTARHKDLALVTRLEAVEGWEVRSDPVRLGRVLANLLVNAIRYTTAGRVEFTAEWREASPDHAEALALGVIDTGTGISKEEQESIFQPFERGQAGDSSGFGSGVGLAVVDRLVEELGLTLEVYSEYGRGSAFHLLLPRAALRKAEGS
jgi:hypothetical protein